MTDITLPREIVEQALKALESMKTYAETVEPGLNVGVPIIAVLRARLAQPNEFNPDWDAMAVMVEEQQRMAKRIAELEAQPEQEPVANIRIWHKNGEQHAELWNWDKGIETLPDGNYDLYTTPPQRKPLTDEQERKHFEHWYSTNAFDYESHPIGSRECGLQWKAWKARAAHGIKGEA